MILVTGGTGLVGSHLLYSLLKDNDRVRAIHRSSSNLDSVKTVFSYFTEDAQAIYDRIEWVEANLSDITALSAALIGVTQVYHSAAYVSMDPNNYYKLKKSNIEGTANLVNLSVANGVKKLCYVSSIATLGSTNNGDLISEETHWKPEEENNVYAITKYGAEMEVWRGSQEGLDVIVLHPGVILGEGVRNSSSGALINSAAKGISYYTNGGVGVVDVKDVIKIMIETMDGSVSNESYVVVGENILYKDLLQKMADHFKAKPPKRQISRSMIKFLSKLDWLMSKLFRTKRKLPKSMVNSLFSISFYDASKVQNGLQMSFTPLDTTLARIANNYSIVS